MKVVIVDSINKIPSHKQFQDLASHLADHGHLVTHFSDTIRSDYCSVQVISYSYKNIWLMLKVFISNFIKTPPDIVISTFRGNRVIDLLSYFFDFKWIAFYQSAFYHQKKYNLLFLRKASVILGVSSPMVSELESMYKHKKGSIDYINNSFEFKNLIAYEKSDIILHVGGMVKNQKGEFVKGTDLVISAFDKLINDNQGFSSELWIVGDGPHLQDIKMLANNNPLIKFTGRVCNTQVHKMMEKAKVFALPSRNDASPNVFLEAMQYGCSLVGTEDTGAVDIIEEGAYGKIVPQTDDVALASAMKELLTSYDYNKVTQAYSNKRKRFARENWINSMVKIMHDNA